MFLTGSAAEVESGSTTLSTGSGGPVIVSVGLLSVGESGLASKSAGGATVGDTAGGMANRLTLAVAAVMQCLADPQGHNRDSQYNFGTSKRASERT